MADMKSKSRDREEPEIKSYKHLLPRELADAMKSCVEKLNDIAIATPTEVEYFSASVTPQHSYLQHLMDDPNKDLPPVLKTNFHATKVGYMTEPESLKTLAGQCGIDLEVKDCGLHFIEKIVRPYEQKNLPTIEELNQLVQVEAPIAEESGAGMSEGEACDYFEEYLNRDDPPKMFVDYGKLEDYDKVRKALRRRRRDFLSDYNDDFGFDDVLPNGELAVGNNGDSDDDSVHSIGIDNESLENDNDDVDAVSRLSKYSVNLSNYEKNLLLNAETANNELPAGRSKRNLFRDPVTGKFVSAGSSSNPEKAKDISSETRDRSMAQSEANEEPELVELDSDYDFDLQDDDISILQEKTLNSNRGETSGYHFTDNESSNKVETLFRPYTDYWMYRCNFGRVKHKNFLKLENDFPDSFRWLLTECANVVEMSEEDLYEEICLVESYHADILRPSYHPASRNNYDRPEYQSKSHCNYVKKKW